MSETINSSYSLQICTDKQLWDDFVSTSPQNNLFCTTQFLDAWGKDYELLLVAKGDANLLGAVLVKDKDGQPTTQPLMYHGVLFGRLVADCPNHKRVKKALELVNFLLVELEQRYSWISFSLHHSFEDVRSFQWFHYHEPEKGQFQIDVNYTGVLDLSQINDFEDLLMNARTVRRQEYRKCIKEGFKIEESGEIEILDKLHEKTFERQGMERTAGEKFMSNELAEKAISQNFGRLIVCRDKKGAPASAALFLFDNKCGYYFIGANDPEYRKYGTGTYVVFEQTRCCMEPGLDTIDFVGVNSPQRGDFKTSFNAVPIPYYTVTWQLP